MVEDSVMGSVDMVVDVVVVIFRLGHTIGSQELH